MEVLIRPFQPDDLDGLFVLDYRCYAPAYRFGYPQLLATLQKPEVSALVIAGERKGDLVGGLIVREEPEEQRAAVVSLMIEAELRRCGLGSRLLRWAGDFARSKGWHAVVVPVERENEGAAAFLAANGYADTGTAQPFFAAPEAGSLWQLELVEGGTP